MHTVISFYPAEIERNMPGLRPSVYKIPASDGVNPQILHVEDAEQLIYVRDGDFIRSSTPAEQIANAIVNDQLRATIHRSHEAEPAIFTLPGKLSEKDILDKFSDLVKEKLSKQMQWFKVLVREADDEWKKTQQHRTITDVQKFAAKFMRLNREWIHLDADDRVYCPVCNQATVSKVVCTNCRAILNEVEYKKFKFATV